ncbi:MAG: DUF4290 domain-containing protein [Bacteroidota bacterium]|nr:DUF4290 domain-containing protein [Bacteroidota bacterium]
MDYNTSRTKLMMPEYGRNIQRMVEHVVNIDDKKERTQAAEEIISIIEQLNPATKDVKDYKSKLWDHIYLMSNFKLDIDFPGGEAPTRESVIPEVNIVPYRSSRIKYRHYGDTVKQMLKHAQTMDDGSNKDMLISLIANHMKKLYLIWNDRHNVSDEDIFRDIVEMTDGKIKIPENLSLSDKKELPSGNFKKRRKSKKKRRRK